MSQHIVNSDIAAYSYRNKQTSLQKEGQNLIGLDVRSEWIRSTMIFRAKIEFTYVRLKEVKFWMPRINRT